MNAENVDFVAQSVLKGVVTGSIPCYRISRGLILAF
jgi:hypothetical protein